MSRAQLLESHTELCAMDVFVPVQGAVLGGMGLIAPKCGEGTKLTPGIGKHCSLCAPPVVLSPCVL